MHIGRYLRRQLLEHASRQLSQLLRACMRRCEHQQMVVTFQNVHGFEKEQAYCALPIQCACVPVLQVMHLQYRALEE